MKHIDSIYKTTAETEKQFIGKKMENMNMLFDNEMEGLKFLNEVGQLTRESESLNL